MKVKPKKQAMISLIKGGAFDNMMDRKMCMAWYLWEVCDKKQMIELSKLPNKEGMISMLLSVLQAPVRQFACAVKAVADSKN